MEILIGAVAEAGLEMILPSSIPTHLYNIFKHWSRLDNVFLSDHSLDLLISCNMLPEQRGVHIDHLPIVTKLNLSTPVAPPRTVHNFREVDWAQFISMVKAKTDQLGPPAAISIRTSWIEHVQKSLKHYRIPSTVKYLQPPSVPCPNAGRQKN